MVPQSKLLESNSWYNDTIDKSLEAEKVLWEQHWQQELAWNNNQTEDESNARNKKQHEAEISAHLDHVPFDALLSILSHELNLNVIYQSLENKRLQQPIHKLKVERIGWLHIIEKIIPKSVHFEYDETASLITLRNSEYQKDKPPASQYMSSMSIEYIQPSIFKQIADHLFNQQQNAPSIVAVDAQNMLLLKSNSAQYQSIDGMRAKLDKPQTLYFVEAWILETNIAHLQSLGFAANYDDDAGSEIQTPMLSSELFLKYAKGLKTFEINGQNQAGQGKIVSNPKFYVLENEQVHLFQGQEVPYVVTSSNDNQNTKFREAGLKLSLKIDKLGNNTLQVDMQLNKDTVDTSKSNPPIAKREIKTQMYMLSGVHTLIGGITVASNSHSKQNLPLFNKVPLLGNLFSHSDQNSDSTQLYLILFIEPLGPKRRLVQS